LVEEFVEAVQEKYSDAIQSIKFHVLIGATGAPGTLTKEIIEQMSSINKRP